jgi:ribosome biogenesis GTPase A
MMGDDDAPDTSSASNAYTSSRQAMVQVMDAVDVAIPQLSRPSQLTEDNRFSLTEDVVVLQKIIDLADVNVALRYL